MMVVGSLNIFIFLKTRDPGSKRFLIAVGFSALAALVFMNQWSLHQWFNYFDISHVFLTFAAIYFYRGSVIIIKSTSENRS